MKTILYFSLYWAFCFSIVTCQYTQYEEDDLPSDGNSFRQQEVEGQGGQSQGQGQEYVDSSEDNNESQASSTVAAVVAASTGPTTVPPITSTINPVHVQGQVNNILSNVNAFNITGIVDQALAIRNNTPVRNLVNGIISSVFCNPFFNRIYTLGCGGVNSLTNPARSLDFEPVQLYDYVVYKVARNSEDSEDKNVENEIYV